MPPPPSAPPAPPAGGGVKEVLVSAQPVPPAPPAFPARPLPGAPLTPQQVAMVQESFELVQPMAIAAAGVFYARLFDLDPGLRRLFPEDLENQKRKLMQVLGAGIRGLSRPETLRPVLRDLGRRHQDYGARPEDYQTVGAALLWTLEQGLGDAFGPDLRAAWTAAYATLAGAMQEGARPEGVLPETPGAAPAYPGAV